MNWIRKIIDENIKWNCFLERVSLVEEKVFSNPDICVETAKSLIEAVCKTILQDKGIEYADGVKLPALIKLTLKSIPFLESLKQHDNDSVNQIVNALGNVTKSVGEVRNNHGYISHGDDALKERVDSLLSQLVLHSTDTVCGFLLQTHVDEHILSERKRIFYEDYIEFNEWYDEVFEPVACGNYVFKASVVLFQNDMTAYRTEIQSYYTETITQNEELDAV